MVRQISQLAYVLVFAIGVLSAPTALRAGHHSAIYSAADGYREAVRAFERQVLRTPQMPSSVERLVDDLEDSTSRLKSAANDPARFDRLMDRFVATDQLHARVQLTFFGDPRFPPGPELESCWFTVDQAYGDLCYEIRYLQQIRSARRGQSVPIVDHGYVGQSYGVVAPPVAPQINVQNSVIYGNSPYRSTYSPTFRLETFGPRPALNGYTPAPALNPQTFHPARSSAGPSVYAAPSGVPHGANLQRRDATDAPTRQAITTRNGLRAAVTGALLQRHP
ncbi:MAG: hypothetical protein KDB00_23750 [Planctomycetales bacterium]|nr:hypothetical protein [Planctomycetales bacterium]